MSFPARIPPISEGEALAALSPFTAGPYLYVAIPEFLYKDTPINATTLIDEWRAMLDPVAAVRESATSDVIQDMGCFLKDWFALAEGATVSLLRECARDDAIVAALATNTHWVSRPTAESEHRVPTDAQRLFRVHDAVSQGSEYEPARVGERGLSILLGLAVHAVGRERIGYAGREFGARRDASSQAVGERFMKLQVEEMINAQHGAPLLDSEEADEGD